MTTRFGLIVLTDEGNLLEFGKALLQQGTALVEGLTAKPSTAEPSLVEQLQPELLGRVRSWLSTEFAENLAPSAGPIRDHFVELAFNPPAAGERISYRATRDLLGLGDDDPYVPAAWASVLRRFTRTVGRPLLVQAGSPVHHGRQDTTYHLDPQSAAAVREAVGPRVTTA